MNIIDSMRRRFSWALLALALAAIPHFLFSQTKSDNAGSASPSDEPQVINPEELVKVLHAGNNLPLILNVGPRMLYQQGHIQGAEFIGPGSSPEAIQQLRTRVRPLAHGAAIVLYCGCCPWSHCPNVKPAYAELRKMGFTNVKVLYIANNIGSDWVYKGYPSVLAK